jgi:hypothetical protein
MVELSKRFDGLSILASSRFDDISNLRKMNRHLADPRILATKFGA